MGLQQFLSDLDAAGVTTLALFPDEGKVRWLGPTLPPALIDAIEAHKAQLLALAEGELIAPPRELARRYTPARRRRGGWPSADCDPWLYANGWTRRGGRWVAPDGTEV